MTAAAIAGATPAAAARPSCPVCGERAAGTFLTRAEIAAELAARDRFFRIRLDRRFARDAVRDLTDVVLGTPAAILCCMRCGVLIRDAAPDDDAFREDRYDERVLRVLHETHARAFLAKESDYRSLVPSDARVFEVGSYAGGFLRAAARWGWRASGADIGRDAARFCRRLGLHVQCAPFEECNLDAQSLDALFVWNCFEQIAEPAALLVEARRALRPAGLLVLRVPDAGVYVRREPLGVLAYNGFLGWPHRFGYDAAAVRRLVEKHGFAFVRTLRRPAIRPLREAMHAWAVEEEARVMADDRHGWIEVTFRTC